MYDPELKYCPQCKDEYMPHAEICAACEVELLAGSILIAQLEEKKDRFASRPDAITDDDDLVIVHGGTMTDLKHIQEIFNLERIACRIVGDDKSCGKGCCPSTFYMQVRREDAPDAAEILATEHERLTGLHEHDLSTADAVFNPDADEVICPACGHVFTPNETTCPDCGLCFG